MGIISEGITAVALPHSRRVLPVGSPWRSYAPDGRWEGVLGLRWGLRGHPQRPQFLHQWPRLPRPARAWIEFSRNKASVGKFVQNGFYANTGLLVRVGDHFGGGGYSQAFLGPSAGWEYFLTPSLGRKFVWLLFWGSSERREGIPDPPGVGPYWNPPPQGG